MLPSWDRRSTDVVHSLLRYAGALPPALAADVQKIGVATLSLNIGAYDNSTRTAINDAILSAVAATSGESATIVGSLLDCLNTIYDDVPTEQCNPNADVSLQSVVAGRIID